MFLHSLGRIQSMAKDRARSVDAGRLRAALTAKTAILLCIIECRMTPKLPMLQETFPTYL